jgi:predicted AAA+ superfamily ATPase
MLETENLKIDVATIENYLDGLLDAFVMQKTTRYDIKGKQHLKTNAKYYVADIGLRYFLLGREGDAGHILENVVYLELLRRGYEVSIGKAGEREVDFVAAKNGSVEYYQVSQELGGKATQGRELRALDAINDHNPKFLLTMDKLFTEEHKGIKILNALDFLAK